MGLDAWTRCMIEFKFRRQRVITCSRDFSPISPANVEVPITQLLHRNTITTERQRTVQERIQNVHQIWIARENEIFIYKASPVPQDWSLLYSMWSYHWAFISNICKTPVTCPPFVWVLWIWIQWFFIFQDNESYCSTMVLTDLCCSTCSKRDHCLVCGITFTDLNISVEMQSQ